MNILLVGPRGSGKSTVGRGLAEKRGDHFIDTDALVLASFDEPTVAEVWARRGEAAWRQAEVRVLRTCLDSDRAVVALGGGLPMIEAAAKEIGRARRQGRAKVIYLRCDAAALRQRLRDEPGDRPALRGTDALAEIQEILAEREPRYLAMADGVVEVSQTTPREALAAVESALAGGQTGVTGRP
jgi:shikimate kinase